MLKYRFRFEDFDTHVKVDDKIVTKDDMIWVFDHHVVGITTTHEYHVINHYNKNFDLSEYKLVDNKYSSTDFCDEWWDHHLKIWEPIVDKMKERKANV